MAASSGDAALPIGAPQLEQKLSRSGRSGAPHVAQAEAAASSASVRRPQCAQKGSP
ncbi:MAG TPA: hypothetical protein VEI06_13325 [Gemmatimonadaceae bacterium]|nr:hypothetical protein [Gemmatimonadaceae bacterium]